MMHMKLPLCFEWLVMERACQLLLLVWSGLLARQPA